MDSASRVGTSTNLPIIDISPWLEPSSTDNAGRRKDVSAALHSACLTHGFFYLNISSFVTPDETDELTRLAREFFSLPEEEKLKLSLSNQDGARGYARLKENVTNGLADNHEGLDFYKPVQMPDRTKPVWGENQWPTVSGFQAKYQIWIEKMKTLGMIVMEAMSVGLGMSHDEWEELKNQVDDSFWVMRVIGYPPLPNDENGFSCGAHKDYGCLTFLYADPTPNALQVFIPNSKLPISPEDVIPPEAKTAGGVWINADPIPGCFVCNIGEMWEVWTNGLYSATLHQVVHRGSNHRVSIPFFFEPNFDALVKPLAAALRLQDCAGNLTNGAKDHSEETTHATKYKPAVYGDFLVGKVGGNFATSKGKYD
ncbi:Clavaminate synthase-like protein [Rickenella mellea]|uniref:Clavaminate synthase-like protein n=1 Tax=Rickenella mellea TaxID=50990 RepID=A0A4Y7Q4V9_9AGAM|nr:Clavaminate synthase-like protein [Rickenella mellea]